MPITHKLQLSAWTIQPTGPNLTLTCFTLPAAAQSTLTQWHQDKTNRSVTRNTFTLGGLPEILALLVPDVAFISNKYHAAFQGERLQLFFQGDRTTDTSLQAQVQSALALWLSLLYPGKDPSMRLEIAAAPTSTLNWSVVEVGTQLKTHAGVCAVPDNPLLFDAILAQAAGHVASRNILFRSGEKMQFVQKTAQSSLFKGVELIAFPPRMHRKGKGYWSEVITLSMATFPERNALHLLAHVSIRNWGAVNYADGYNAPLRNMDVFMRNPATGLTGAATETPSDSYRHSNFAFKAERAQTDTGNGLAARWPHNKDERLVNLICRLSGVWPLEAGDAIVPVTNNQGLWIMPRLGSNHGDRFLPGGTGVGWHDRMDISQELDRLLAPLGLDRVPPLSRYTRRFFLRSPFGYDGQHTERREALCKTLAQLGQSGTPLDIFVFHLSDNAVAQVAHELITYLGEPSEQQDNILFWDNRRLAIRIRHALPGPLAAQLADARLTQEEKTGLSRASIDALEKKRRREFAQDARQKMVSHLQQIRGEAAQTVACAILEMSAALRDTPATDPYVLARQELARHRILPQVVLIDAETPNDKYRMAVRDCLRMLGVVPVPDKELGFAPAAITVVQLNEKSGGPVKRNGLTFPLAARVRQGVFECALPSEGRPHWLPYAEATLRVLTGQFDTYDRSSTHESLHAYAAFFAAALEQIDHHGPSLVVVEPTTLAHKLPALHNANLTFDRLTIGTRTFTPDQLPNTRIVRLSQELGQKQTHYHEGSSKEVSGFFTWGSAQRTFYASKPSALSLKTVKVNATVSRHSINVTEQREEALRKITPTDELCVMFCQPNDEPAALAQLAHKLRKTHVQYDDSTCISFPLHELRLLGLSATAGA